MPVVVNVIAMTLIQQSGKEKLLIVKIKTHSFHPANISYRHISYRNISYRHKLSLITFIPFFYNCHNSLGNHSTNSLSATA